MHLISMNYAETFLSSTNLTMTEVHKNPHMDPLTFAISATVTRSFMAIKSNECTVQCVQASDSRASPHPKSAITAVVPFLQCKRKSKA